MKGDYTFCLYRDTAVVVTAWTAARIPWPRCRSLESRGGAGLLVSKELKRAIRSESAAALLHWFGVSQHAVWNWRRAFGVGRLATPGSRPLRTAINRGLAAATRGRKVLAAERKRWRRAAIDANAGERLQGRRWAGTGWTKEQLARLGTKPNAKLAKLFGRSEGALRQRRTRLGIPTFLTGGGRTSAHADLASQKTGWTRPRCRRS
jgi:transposase-like protein